MLLETMTLDYINMHDRPVASLFKAWYNYKLWQAYSVLMDRVNPDDEADVDRTVAEVKNLFAQFPWMPTAIRDLLDGKNHLPDNKRRLNLFNRRVGFMGSRESRTHFFRDLNLPQLLYRAARDEKKCSVRGLRKRRLHYSRLAWQTNL